MMEFAIDFDLADGHSGKRMTFPGSVAPDDGTNAGEQGMAKTTEAKTTRGPRLTTMVAGGVSLALTYLPGAALAAPMAWEGYATVTASTAQCSGVGGTSPGDTHVSIFRPKIAATDSPTFLSFVFLRAAVTQENTSESTVHQMNGSGNYTGFLIGSRAGFAQYTGTYHLTITPATVTVATPSVTIDGTITNFLNTTGCNVTFEGAYVERID
jgi:hypothetical protein